MTPSREGSRKVGRVMRLMLAFAAGLLAAVIGFVIFLAVVAGLQAGSGGTVTTPDLTTEVSPPSGLGEQDTWMSAMTLDADVMITGDTMLQDVTATGTGMTTTADGGTTVDNLQVSATVPYAVIAQEVGENTQVAPEDGVLRIQRRVDVMGQPLDVFATCAVAAEDGMLKISPISVDLGGPGWMQAVGEQIVRGLLTVQQPVEGLPDGLSLQSVEVGDTGLDMELGGQNVRLDQ